MWNILDRFHLIWADRIILWVAAGIGALAALCWCLVAVAAGVDGANHVVVSFGADSGDDVVLVLLTLWAALRAIDFIGHGATYKLLHRSDAPHPSSEAPSASTGKPMAAV
jgi:hypothetical protein